jgi:tetratricopeptide (TPR) repeat protein
VLFIAGCSRLTSSFDFQFKPDPYPFRILSTYSPADAEEAEQFGRRLETDYLSGDPLALKKALRHKDILQRALDKLPSQSSLTEYRRTIENIDFEFGVILSDHYHRGDEFKYIGLVKENNRNCCLFRIRDKVRTNDFDYIKFPIVFYPDGDLGIEDVYDLKWGTYLTDLALPKLLRSAFRKPKDDMRLFSKFDPTQKAIAKAMRDDEGNLKPDEETMNPKSLYTSYLLLSPELRKEKIWLTQGLKGAIAVSEQAERDNVQSQDIALRELVQLSRDLYPKDGCVDYLAFNYFRRKRNYAECEYAINRLLANVCLDANLLTWKAYILKKRDRFEEALKIVDEAIRIEPEFLQAKLEKAFILIESEQYEAALEILAALKRLDSKTKWLDQMESTPNSRAFIQSSEYRQFRDGK